MKQSLNDYDGLRISVTTDDASTDIVVASSGTLPGTMSSYLVLWRGGGMMCI